MVVIVVEIAALVSVMPVVVGGCSGCCSFIDVTDFHWSF